MKIHSLKAPQLSQQEKKELRKLGEAMEGHFSKHLIKQMRKSVPKEKMSQTESFYQGLLDEKYAEQMAKSDSGLGIKDLILEYYGVEKNFRPQATKDSGYGKD